MDVKTSKSMVIVIRYKNNWFHQRQDLMLMLLLLLLRKTPTSVLLDKSKMQKTET